MIALFAGGALLASYSISYTGTRTLLSDLYGPGRTARYFNMSVFQSAIHRLSGMAVLLAWLTGAIVAGRGWLARFLQPSFTVLILSFRHFRRIRVACDATTVTVLSLITAIAALLRIALLKQPMRYDEAATVLAYASQPLHFSLSLYNEPNNHLFHTLLVHISMRLLGASEWAVRLPACIAGCLLPVVVFWLVIRLSNKSAAFLAAAFVATSSVLVEFSTNARGYTIVCVLTVALLICGMETLRRASPAWFVLFTLCAVLGCWTIPLFVFPFVGAVTWLVWEINARSRRMRKVYWTRLTLGIVATTLSTAVLYLPVVVVNGPAALFANKFVLPLRGRTVVGQNAWWRSFEFFLQGNAGELHRLWGIWNRDLPLWWPLIAAIASAYCLFTRPRLRRLGISVVASVATLFVARHLMLSPRNWIMFLPLLFSGCAIGFADLFAIVCKAERTRTRLAACASPILAGVLALAVLDSGSVLASTDTGILTSAREIAQFLAARQVTADRVVCSYGSEIPLQYYWWRQTGEHQPNMLTTADAVRSSGIPDAWVVVNKAYGETLGQSRRKLAVSDYLVIEQREFRDAVAYHVSRRP